MAKNLISHLILARLAHIWAPKIFCRFYLKQMLEIVASYHCMQFQQKLMIQTQENGGKLHFEPDLGPLGLVKFALRIYFFFGNLASSVTRYHGQLSSCTISEKTNDPILRKLSDGRTDGQTDGRE